MLGFFSFNFKLDIILPHDAAIYALHPFLSVLIGFLSLCYALNDVCVYCEFECI